MLRLPVFYLPSHTRVGKLLNAVEVLCGRLELEDCACRTLREVTLKCRDRPSLMSVFESHGCIDDDSKCSRRESGSVFHLFAKHFDAPAETAGNAHFFFPQVLDELSDQAIGPSGRLQ